MKTKILLLVLLIASLGLSAQSEKIVGTEWDSDDIYLYFCSDGTFDYDDGWYDGEGTYSYDIYTRRGKLTFDYGDTYTFGVNQDFTTISIYDYYYKDSDDKNAYTYFVSRGDGNCYETNNTSSSNYSSSNTTTTQNKTTIPNDECWLKFWAPPCAIEQSGGSIGIYYDGREVGRIYTSRYSEPSDWEDNMSCVVYKAKISGGATHECYAKGYNGTIFSNHVDMPGGHSVTLKMECSGSSTSSSTGSTSSSSGHSSSSNYSSNSSDYSALSKEDLGKIGFGLALVYVAISAIQASTDVYMNYTEGPIVRGFNFGLRNSQNEHIDLEYGTSYTQWQTDRWFSKAQSFKPAFWSFDFAALYNILPKKREPFAFNPYFGFATSVYPLAKLENQEQPTYLGMGGVIGFSFGGRFKVHARYKYLRDWFHEKTLVNQIEVGFSLTYKYGWKWTDQ
jgi:hypothetical protein